MPLPDPLPIDAHRRPARRRRRRCPGRRASPTGRWCARRWPTAPARSPTRCTPTTPRRWSRGCARSGAEIDADWADGRLDGHRHGGPPDQRRGARRRPAVGHHEPVPAPGRRAGRGAPPRRRRQPHARAPDGRGARRGARPRRRGARGRRARSPARSRSIGGTLAGGEVAVRGDVSSQFLSGLLLAGPAMRDRAGGPARRRPRVAALRRHDRGGDGSASASTVERPDERTWVVAPQAYRATDLRHRARRQRRVLRLRGRGARSAAGPPSPGSGDGSLQGDLAFVDVLEQMGATVERDAPTPPRSPAPGALRGVEVDLARSPTPPRPSPSWPPSPTARRGDRHRLHPRQGDRPHRRRRRRAAPARASTPTEEPDGFTVHPGPLRAGHRRRPTTTTAWRWRSPCRPAVPTASQIADPGCVAKTFPGYWRPPRRAAEPRHDGGTMVRPAMRVIAIDGPAGSGKSTVAKALAGAARARLPRHRRHVPLGHLRRAAARRRPVRGRAGRRASSRTSSSRSATTASPSTASTPPSRSAARR